MDIFLFGAGYSAHYFLESLRADPAVKIRSVTATIRRPEQAAILRSNGIRPILFDAEQGLSAEFRDELQYATHVISSVSPTGTEPDNADPILSLMPEGLETYAPNLRFAAYLSTIGVYGDHQGAWVNETTPLTPLSAHSKARVAAEKQWLNHCSDTEIALAILRIAGIYGPAFQGQARNALAAVKAGRTQRMIKKDHVFNRIHVADIGGFLKYLAVQDKGGIYNLADDEPEAAHVITSYAAQLLGEELPPAIDYDAAEQSPMARSFYQECKRASNKALKATGYQLRYPNYRDGLKSLYAQGEGR